MMSNDEKLKNFERQALQKAEQRRDEINRELDNATGEALADCKKVFRRETAKIRGKGVEEARKEARLIVSTAQNKGQSAIMSKRNEIIDEVFGALVTKLRAFTESTDGSYGELFEKRLTEATASVSLFGFIRGSRSPSPCHPLREGSSPRRAAGGRRRRDRRDGP